MKAIILAGGEGTRLRPLTCRVPKPMVRLFDQPILAHTLKALAKAGITEAAVTLRYLPYAVQSYFGKKAFGIELSYFTETDPLGTAGAVKACEEFCGGETVLVVSGDGIWDFDLSAAFEFHAAREAEATMLLYAHPEPLSYGIVQTDVRDCVVGFAEKPGWGEVFTDRVNTGIYILSPQVFRRIPKGRPFDFSKDLFPGMVEEKGKLFALCMPGYWQDLGNTESYLSCVKDALAGKIRLFPGKERTDLPQGVTLEGPCFLSEECHLSPEVHLGPGAVIQSGARLGTGCTVCDSVISGTLGSNVTARGAVVDRGALVESGAVLSPGCVVGAGAHLGPGVFLAPGVAVWPEVTVEAGCRVEESISGGSRLLPVEKEGALTGDLGVEMTPEFFLRLGRVCGREKKRILISGTPLWALLSLGAGISSAGGECFALDASLPGFCALCTKIYAAGLGIDLRTEDNRVTARFFDRRGLPLSRDGMTKITAGLRMGAEPSAVQMGCSPRRIEGVDELIISLAANRFPCENASVGARPGSPEARALTLSGAKVSPDGSPFFALSPDGFGFTVTEGDRRLDEAHAETALYAALFSARRKAVLPCRAHSPALLEVFAKHSDGKLLRVGQDEGAEEALSEHPECAGGLFGLLCLCHLLNRHHIGLSELCDRLPEFTRLSKEVPAAGGRASTMERLGRAFPDARRGEGLRVPVGRDSVSVRPSFSRESLTVTAEAGDAEIAEELCANIERIIRDLPENAGR